jgi:hypothetical protein
MELIQALALAGMLTFALRGLEAWVTSVQVTR